MAQRAGGTGKRSPGFGLSLKEKDVPTPKQLKQGRLPFKALGCKPLTPVNNSTPKKRKLSGPDSPNSKAKQPRLPGMKVSSDKVTPVGGDNEVSSTSSSENEHTNIDGTKTKTAKGNTLEKFVRREDEISSTNEIIDLTDCVDENNPVENSPVKTSSPRKAVLKSLLPQSESQSKDKVEMNFSRKLVFEKEETDQKKNVSLSASAEKKQENKDEPMECDVTDFCDKEETEKDEDASKDEEAVNSPDKSIDSSICETSQNDVDDSTTPQKDDCVSESKTPSSRKSPLSSCTPQTPASADTSRSSADGTTPSTGKKPLSRKQLERQAMRQKVKDEKERQKQEAKDQKEKERLEKKQKRDEEKAEKDRMKKEEKEKKEKERLEKKELAEKEKQEKQYQKEEEKQKKMETLSAKAEEKKKKEEERKQKEEQKQKEEEEKLKQAEKRKAAFTSFFVKPKAVTSTKVSKAEDNLFIPFEVKKDMTLAPVYRHLLSDTARNHLVTALHSQEVNTTFLDELKQGKKPVRTNRILRKRKEAEQDVVLVHDSETVKKVTHAVKLLQFHTDYRPPYFGTWRKPVTGLCPRNPWKKDEAMFDYEVDSDEEWEEEEPGESLSDSNGEEEDGGDEEEDGEDDGWMVPHGYLSEDECCDEDEDVTPEVLKARQRAKAQAWETELKAKKQMLPPLHLGCFWQDGPCVPDKHTNIFTDFEMVCLRTSPLETLVSCPPQGEGAGEKSQEKSKSPTASKGCRKRALPEEAMPDLIRLVHGNTYGIKKLVREFRLYWKQRCGEANLSLDKSTAEDGETKGLDDSAMDTSTTLDSSVLDNSTHSPHHPASNAQSADSAAESKTQPAGTVTQSTDTAMEAESAEESNKSASTDTAVQASKTDPVAVEPMQTESEGNKDVPEKPDDNSFADDSLDSGVSKRQLEMKITAIAVREKREGKKKHCWYVHDSVLKQYNMQDISTDNVWEYVSGDMSKKVTEKKTPTQTKTQTDKKMSNPSTDKTKPQTVKTDATSEVETTSTPVKEKEGGKDGTPKTTKSKKETSAKKKLKDQPSIMAFAKKPAEKKAAETKAAVVAKASKESETKAAVVVEASQKDVTKNTATGDTQTGENTEKPAGSQQAMDVDDDCIILD